MVDATLIQHDSAIGKRFIVLIPSRTFHRRLWKAIAIDAETIRATAEFLRVAIAKHVAATIRSRLTIDPVAAPTLRRVLESSIHEAFLKTGIRARLDRHLRTTAQGSYLLRQSAIRRVSGKVIRKTLDNNEELTYS